MHVPENVSPAGSIAGKESASNDTNPMCDCEQEPVTKPGASRRTFMFMGVGFLLAGCAPSNSSTSLPGPIWRPRTLEPAPNDGVAAAPPPQLSGPAGVVSRAKWSGGGPATSLMNRMTPIQCITVHHDGMEPFWSTNQSSAASRLESIRRAHRDKGWGDIGYHFAIDRDGRIWECRSILWQGAHVKDQNEGNIGVVTLGNFDRQSPSTAQLSALNRCVSSLMNRYKIPMKKVMTHQEWPTAHTACPGTNLQRYMAAVRNNRQLG